MANYRLRSVWRTWSGGPFERVTLKCWRVTFYVQPQDSTRLIVNGTPLGPVLFGGGLTTSIVAIPLGGVLVDGKPVPLSDEFYIGDNTGAPTLFWVEEYLDPIQ